MQQQQSLLLIWIKY